ncbi:MAG: undecaprenyl/decaprenyl-phosphate alpha-N-acetylglucosaminyl 1-phosphate transferase [Bifidobacteriaceae bacterium]|jgi:UDP-GlcNAc:undecaprenyl-phosphate GlcNAc-1-phosphate transferase|nr:undecaprenyl/decaprenyl-phosphate alpha-N-acetylglucosaminyl 1-phosphate transferase [Bifidobacteriaceae bacterium]
MRVYIFIAAVAGGATYLLIPLIRHLAIDMGAVGEVRARDVHTVPTPRMGGLGMLLGFAVAVCFAFGTPWISGLFIGNTQPWVILVGAVLICLLGIADDIWDLDWMLKLAGQLLIAVFVSWQGVQIISLPWGRSLITASPSVSMAVTAFLIVASINAVNFVDGLDGLAAGIVAIGGIAFAFYSYFLSRDQPSYTSMATLLDVALVGICVGFILHNWHPAKLFMGDSGSMLLGYLLTCASIVMTGRFDPSTMGSGAYLPVFMPILLPILVLFIPVLDMVLAIVRRVSHGHSPMHPDRMHLHHRMLRIGHSVRSAVLIMWGWAFLIAFASTLTLFVPLVDVLIGVVIIVPILTVATLAPHYSRRMREIRKEERTHGSSQLPE